MSPQSNHSTQNTYPLDVFGIKTLGTQNWLKDFYLPVTGQNYKEIHDFIFNCYIEQLTTFPKREDLYWLALSNIKIVHWISCYAFQILRKKRLKESNHLYFASKEIVPIDDVSIFSLQYDIPNFIFNCSRKEKIKIWARFLRDFSTAKIAKREHIFVLGNSQQKEVQDYLSVHGLTPIVLSRYLFSSKEVVANVAQLERIGLKTPLDNFLQQVVNKFPFLEEILPQLLDELSKILISTHGVFLRNVSFFEKLKNQPLLATGLGSPLQRIVMAAWRYTGKPVIGFSHGNTYATGYDTLQLTDGISIVTDYHATSKGEAFQFQKLADEHAHHLKMSQIVTPKTSMYQDLFEDLQKQEKPTPKINRVMIVGFPLNDRFYPSFPSHHAFSNLHLELRLYNILTDAGYEVYYKAHPTRIEEAKAMFDNVLTEPFEKIYTLGDCILFSHSRTTTFGFTMLTPKPMVLINVSDVPWEQNAFQLVQKRCKVVPAQPGEKGDILFDKDQLLQAVQTSPQFSYDVVTELAL